MLRNSRVSTCVCVCRGAGERVMYWNSILASPGRSTQCSVLMSKCASWFQQLRVCASWHCFWHATHTKDRLQSLCYLWPCVCVSLEAKSRGWTAWFESFWALERPPRALCQHPDKRGCVPAIINWRRYACTQNLKHWLWLSESTRVIRGQGSYLPVNLLKHKNLNNNT